MYFLRRGQATFVDDVIYVLWLTGAERKVVYSPWEEGIILPVVDFATFLHFSSIDDYYSSDIVYTRTNNLMNFLSVRGRVERESCL
jgi:hypothetical protein